MSLSRLKLAVVCLGLCLFATLNVNDVNAQAPAASRGIQLLPIAPDECMRRGRAALEGEGYTIWNTSGPDFYFSDKQSHTAVLMCSPAADGKIWVNIVVATAGANDGGIPGAERVRLQERMSGVSRPPTVTFTTTWATQAKELSEQPGMRFTLNCPARGEISSRLWGTDLYTNDSSVCTAAVHSGLITVANGGTVTIETRVGLSSYMGSARFGVTSQSYGSWGGSFVFLR